MAFLVAFIFFTYLAGAFFMIRTYVEEGFLKVNDVVMLIVAPFAVVPVLAIHIVSHFVDLERVIVHKQS